MFAHIFFGRIRLLTRNKAEVFWTLVYPIILAVFFSMAFSNLANADKFTTIPIAVVENEELRSQDTFVTALTSASSSSEAGHEPYFEVSYTTKDQADESLSDNTIKGYILFDNGPHLVVKDSGIQQSFIKAFLDSIVQVGSSVKAIISQNPAAAGAIGYNGGTTYLTEASPVKTQSNLITVMFYGLLSMTAMFGGFWGRKEVEDIQADLSPQAMRMNLAPVQKMKAFTASMIAAIVIHVGCMLTVVAFMAVILGVDFGSRLGYVVLTCFCAGIMGVTFGGFIAAIVRNANIRMAAMLTVSLVLSSIAGMVSPQLKFAVTEAAPIMAYINPANLVTDAFYSLFCYSSNTRFFINIALMLGFSALFSGVVYLVTRRQKYASL